MSIITTTSRQLAAAHQNKKEKAYWLEKLAGHPVKSVFPHYRSVAADKGKRAWVSWSGDLQARLETFSGGSDQKLHVVLAAGLSAVLSRVTDSRDLLLGTPIFRAPRDAGTGDGADYINTLLVLRTTLTDDPTFKELILAVRQTIVEAVQHQDYPLGVLLEQLGYDDREFPLFDWVMVLENIQDRAHAAVLESHMGLVFYFKRNNGTTEADIFFNSEFYSEGVVRRCAAYLERMLGSGIDNPDLRLSQLEMIPEEERRLLVQDFNATDADYESERCIHQLIAQQAARTPAVIAATDAGGNEISYGQLDENAALLACLLRSKGVSGDGVVGLMMERSVASVTAMLAILKAGGAYLPIDTNLPAERVRYMLEDSGAKILVSDFQTADRVSFTTLQNLDGAKDIQLVMTPHRPYIKEFGQLPVPDRSLLDMTKYRGKIGMAGVSDCISLQTTRGCPYECLFCHKVWSKRHVFRSAESIFAEVKHYYELGVRNFSVIDDCFNLNKENSERFFRLVIDGGLKVQLFFPNGLRGDLLTHDYIDLMTAAGTRGINLSLETASPRLQTLVKKNLDIERFRDNINYIARAHPEVILEIAVMHGFPTETEEEALVTLEFIKSVQWIHFPYIHILKIYPNTEMETLALKQGVTKEDILASKDLAFHELPSTLPFPGSFTRKYQAAFLNDYFLNKDRLRAVLPVQLEVMSEAALVEKYNTYLPAKICNFQDLLTLTGLEDVFPVQVPRKKESVPEVFTRTGPPAFPVGVEADALRILMLDLSQHFSSHEMLYNVTEQPLGLISLLTYLKQEMGDRVSGRMYKSGNDFDDFAALKELVLAFEPHLIAVRTLTFYKEFFHETVSMLRQWGIQVPIIAGGPYATSDYAAILKDRHVDLAVFGEGEFTLLELVETMAANGMRLPANETLRGIGGLIFADDPGDQKGTLEVIITDKLSELADLSELQDLSVDCRSGEPERPVRADNLAYVMYTSGSTGKPKGVMVEHRQVNNCLAWMQRQFPLQKGNVVAQRTNLSFDPSVWEIFWPLYHGGTVRIYDEVQRKDAAFLVRAMETAHQTGLTVMYCPSTLLYVLVHYLEMNPNKPRLTLPWFIIGAEPVTMETVQRFYHFFAGRVVNTYGPTEGTINNTYFHLQRGSEELTVPIGKPVDNNRIYIMSRRLELLPLGMPGEICIAGAGLARGYINDRDKTLSQFIDNPFGAGKLYRTGDVGRFLEDGNIEIMGRLDQQLKIRGHRIEIAEVENAVAGFPAVTEAVVTAKTLAELKEQVRECRICGIWSNYPGIKVNDEQVCNICENLSLYKKLINEYFQTEADFEFKLREGNRNRDGDYDCILVYACERVATYALYKLLDMGFKVLTVTYDSGHYDQAGLDRIKRITTNLGVDHIFLRHKDSDRILRESLKVAKTMCKGCIHTSSSLAGEHAYKNNIKFVIGETLSRGQIVENKLFKFLDLGIHDVAEIEREVKNLMRNVAAMDKSIYDIINIDVVKDGSLYDKVEFIDFYRYFEISNEEMAAYLDEKDTYWKNLENRAAYSTDCKICQVGDFNHMKELGYHYTGSAKSWEKRLGQATIKEVKDDLKMTISADEYHRFLDNLGYQPELEVQQDQKYLCAYFTADSAMETSVLIDYLSGLLPEYMVPAYYVQLEKIPLTANGKIDRKGLPAPQLTDRGNEEYAAPETDVEEKLREVWQEVLGVADIGVNDDLFKLGGDSIKAIRIASKLQRFNLKLEIKDLFQNPTVRKSAPLVESLSDAPRADQGRVGGELPLTPVQCWFFQQVTVEPSHFNQAVMLYREQGFDEVLLTKVLARLTDHHDALRMVFKSSDGGGQLNLETVVSPQLEVIALSTHQEVRHKADGIQASFNLETGPLIKAALFRGVDEKRGDYLLVVIHHLVVDGISWRVLLEDLEIAYLQAQQGIDITFQPKTHSFREWAHKLNEYAQSPQAAAEADFWRKSTVRTPLPIAPRSDAHPRPASASLRLEAEESRRLLTDAHLAFNTQINDLLLAALAQALHRWTGAPGTVICLEGHGREAVLEGMDIGRTVGWFTTMFPVLLETGDSLAGTVKGVKEMLRNVPSKGFGYGVLRYLTKDRSIEAADPEIVFNYQGRVGDETGMMGEVFQLSSMPLGSLRSPKAPLTHGLAVEAMVLEGCLSVSFHFDENRLEVAAVEQLAGFYKESLAQVSALGSAGQETEKTVSDYDAIDLDEEELDSVYDELELE